MKNLFIKKIKLSLFFMIMILGACNQEIPKDIPQENTATKSALQCTGQTEETDHGEGFGQESWVEKGDP